MPRITGERVNQNLLKIVEEQTGTGEVEEIEIGTPIFGFGGMVKPRDKFSNTKNKKEDYSNIIIPKFRK